MASIEWTPQQLFHRFQEPVLVLENGAVYYFNPVAGRLLPTLEVGGVVPEELAPLLSRDRAEWVSGGAVGGQGFRVSGQDMDKGQTLVILRPDGQSSQGPSLARLALRLRQETAGLSIALQRIDPNEEAPNREMWNRYMAAANQGVYRLMRLVGHLELADAKDEELYHPTSLDLAGFCKKLCQEAGSALSMAGYRFDYESEFTSLITVGDERLLGQMLLSLISNAVKALGREGALGLRLGKSRNRAMITVWDEGEGLKEGDLGRIFGSADPEVSTDPGDGLGLGLEAVRRIVMLHGGSVMVEGRPGEGLRVVVSLPVIPAGEQMPLRSPVGEYSGGFSPVMVELSDVLPARLYAPEDLR